MSAFGITRTLLSTQLAEAIEADKVCYDDRNQLWPDKGSIEKFINDTATAHVELAVNQIDRLAALRKAHSFISRLLPSLEDAAKQESRMFARTTIGRRRYKEAIELMRELYRALK